MVFILFITYTTDCADSTRWHTQRFFYPQIIIKHKLKCDQTLWSVAQASLCKKFHVFSVNFYYFGKWRKPRVDQLSFISPFKYLKSSVYQLRLNKSNSAGWEIKSHSCGQLWFNKINLKKNYISPDTVTHIWVYLGIPITDTGKQDT